MDNDGETLDVRVFAGTVVDTDRLHELARLMGAALEGIAEAEHHLAYVRALVWGNAFRAPATSPQVAAAIESVRDHGDCLQGLRSQVEDLRADLGAAIAAYEEAEHTASNTLRSSHPAFIHFLVGAALLVLPVLGVPTWVLPAAATALAVASTRSAGRQGVPLLLNGQAHLRGAALWFVPMIKPTGVLHTRDGRVLASQLTPVEALAASLLDVTGFDHFGGDVRVWLDQGSGRTAASRSPSAVAEVRHWEVTRRDVVAPGAGIAVAPLRSTADVAARLERIARRSTATGTGEVELIAQRGADGRRAWTVVVPGTRETWAAANPQDHLSNVQLVGEQRSDAMLAVLQAIEMAPIRPGEPLVLVGHSQGGIVAAELAADPVLNARHGVAGLITYGAPVGQVEGLVRSVPSLHLENVRDVVPALDGLANEAGPRNVTVQFDGEGTGVGGSPHGVATHQAALDRVLAEGEAPEVEGLLAGIAHAAAWDDPAATAEVYRFRFARTDAVGNWTETARHLGDG